MPKKRYYKKKYYKNNDYNNHYYENENFDSTKIYAIIITIILFILYYLFYKYILPNLEIVILGLKIFIPFLIISLGLILFYLHKKNKEKVIQKIKEMPKFIINLENEIKEFKPFGKYTKEEQYQKELASYLKYNYSNLEIEKTKDYSRPDIVIDNIAIEIKGPTNMSGLKSLPDKINHYLDKWDYLFIVLFDINIVPYKSKEENIQIYKDKKNEILDNTIEEKRKKITFIEI